MRYYIAYGSNLSINQIKKRCPQVEFVGTANLENYKLEFKTAYGGRAFATVTPSNGCSVQVAVFKLTPNDEKNLDFYEGVKGKHYFKEMLDIMVNGRMLRAMVYRMNLASVHSLPSIEYLSTIYEGYEDYDFDMSVVDIAIAESIK